MRFFFYGFALIVILASAMNGCSAPPTHNAHGGYIHACGDTPPVIGDDC